MQSVLDRYLDSLRDEDKPAFRVLFNGGKKITYCIKPTSDDEYLAAVRYGLPLYSYRHAHVTAFKS